tara:strand:- start:943 stop:1692 length:750 start_codon:yes stop_codon:yes gene_type:complete
MKLLKKGLLGFKKEDPRKKAEIVLKKITLEKIVSIKEKGFSKEGFDKASQVFKIFLMKYFEIGYEFTHSELKRELNKKKIADELKSKILKTSDLINEVNYKNKKLTKQLFNQLLKDTEETVDLTTITISIKKNIELLKKKLEEDTKAEKEESKKKEAVQENVKRVSWPEMLELESEMFELEQLFKMITDAQNALLNFDLDDAKHIYLGVLHIYKNLSLEQQEKVFPSIKELYNTRKRLLYVLNPPTSTS